MKNKTFAVIEIYSEGFLWGTTVCEMNGNIANCANNKTIEFADKTACGTISMTSDRINYVIHSEMNSSYKSAAKVAKKIWEDQKITLHGGGFQKILDLSEICWW